MALKGYKSYYENFIQTNENSKFEVIPGYTAEHFIQCRHFIRLSANSMLQNGDVVLTEIRGGEGDVRLIISGRGDTISSAGWNDTHSVPHTTPAYYNGIPCPLVPSSSTRSVTLPRYRLVTLPALSSPPG